MRFALPAATAAVATAALVALPIGPDRHLRPAPSLHARRATHTATTLRDGRVLIAGGFFKDSGGYRQVYESSAELFDPSAGTLRAAGRLGDARAGHTATLLRDGRVLMAGGWYADGTLATSEIFDPATLSFRRTGDLATQRAGHTATLLPDGRVLIAGGTTGDHQPPLPAAEIYDPRTGAFAKAARLLLPRLGHTATALPDGRVLILGGRRGDDPAVLATSEIYVPSTTTGRFVAGPSLRTARYKHAAVALADGRVLVIGGSDARDWRGQLTSTELCDASAPSCVAAPSLTSARFKLPGAAVRLGNGAVLVAGGSDVVEIFEPSASAFRRVATLPFPIYYATASLLPDGRVLVTGGYDTRPQSTDRTFVVTPGG